jgi:hypothetical protein
LQEESVKNGRRVDIYSCPLRAAFAFLQGWILQKLAGNVRVGRICVAGLRRMRTTGAKISHLPLEIRA